MMTNFFNSNPDSALDKIVFEKRNQNYGAFVLRNEEGFILRKALFVGVSICVALAVTPLIINLLKTDVVIQNPVTENPGYIFKPIEEIDKPEKKIETVKPIEKKVKTFDSRTPTPTRNPINEKPAPKVDDYKKAVAGTQDVKGDDPIVPYTPPVTIPSTTNGGNPDAPVKVPAEDSKAIETTVDVKADFMGGINKFRNQVLGNMDASDFEDEGTIKTEVTFVVEKDGSISNVVAKGKDQYFNKEAEKAVKSVKGIWKPAELKGKKVRSYFKIPITLQFD